MYLIKKKYKDAPPNMKEVIKRMNQKCIDKNRVLQKRRNIRTINENSTANPSANPMQTSGNKSIEEPHLDEGLNS